MYCKWNFILSIFLISAFQSLSVLAQEEEILLPKPPKGSVADRIKDRSFDDTQILLKQEFTAGGMIHSQGWGLLLRRSKNKTFLKKRLFELEVVSMEHPKEVKITNPYYENSNSYMYGELNQVVVSRLGYGRHNVLYAKFDRGIEIRYLYIGGFSMAWAKPIYLEIGYPTLPYEYTVTERYNPDKHYPDNIFGRASVFKGIEKMQFYPGIYGKFGFSFEYARKPKSVRSVEVGVIVDYYVRDVPMMANIKNNPYYLTFYLALNFGVKWYR
ncbi:hypothetical protein ACFLR1_05265 [Bacteroidota bacterium]